MENLFEVIYEDAELLVINKPAGLVCHPTKGGIYSSLISRVRLHLQGGPAHLLNRLDRETSGVVLVAKNRSLAGELGKALENRSIDKEYHAIVHGRVAEKQGAIDAPLGKDERSPVAIKDQVRPDGAPARTDFWVERIFVRNGADFTLLRIVPRTGRKHQIRIHLAYRGHPIVGDKLYGRDENLYLDFVKGRLTDAQWRTLLLPHHALHASKVEFSWRGAARIFSAPPENWFLDFAMASEPELQPGKSHGRRREQADLAQNLPHMLAPSR
jgi:23S rRNA pseudouridine1911/1915/1917 synthase